MVANAEEAAMHEHDKLNVTLELPVMLKRAGRIRAAALGMPLAEYIRRLIRKDVDGSGAEELATRTDEEVQS
jgi:predicted DNA binding CopG/RHH family protein